MIGNIRIHRPNHTEVVGHAANLGKETGNLQSGLPHVRKFERRLEGRPGRPFRLKHFWQFLTMEPGQLRLWVKGIEVGGAPVHEQMDDGLGFAWKLRASRREGIQADTCPGLLRRCNKPRDPVESHPSHPHAATR